MESSTIFDLYVWYFKHKVKRVTKILKNFTSYRLKLNNSLSCIRFIHYWNLSFPPNYSHTFLQSVYRVIAQIFLNIIRNVILLIHYDFIPFPFPSSIIRTRKTLSCCSRFGGKKYKEQGIGNNSGKLDRVNSLPFYYFPSPLLSFPLFTTQRDLDEFSEYLYLTIARERGLKLEGCSLSFRHLISARFVIFQYSVGEGQTVIEDNAKRL